MGIILLNSESLKLITGAQDISFKSSLNRVNSPNKNLFPTQHVSLRLFSSVLECIWFISQVFVSVQVRTFKSLVKDYNLQPRSEQSQLLQGCLMAVSESLLCILSHSEVSWFKMPQRDSDNTVKKINPIGDICFHCCCQQHHCNLHEDAFKESVLSHLGCHSCCPGCLGMSMCTGSVRCFQCKTALYSSSLLTTTQTWEFPAKSERSDLAHTHALAGASVSVMRCQGIQEQPSLQSFLCILC